MNLRDFASALRRSWLVIAAATVVGLASGWAVGNVARTVYTTTSRVVVLAAPEVGNPEDAQRITSMIRSEMSLYQVLAQGNRLTERVATRVTGITAEQVAGATTVVFSDQLLSLTVTLPDKEQSVKVAKAFADEMVAEIKGLHPADPQLLRAEAVEAPVRTVTTGVSRGASLAAGGVLGIISGLIIVWGLAALRPLVASGGALAAGGRLVLRAKADAKAFEQLAAVLSPHLKDSKTEKVVLVGTGERVNLGPWRQGLSEQLGAEAAAVTAAPDGADPVALRAVSGGEITVLLTDRQDSLNRVQETLRLLEAAGANLTACLVVSEPRS